MIPYNSRAPTEAMKRRGVSMECPRGSFSFDIVFTTSDKQPGFVVQYIRKTLTYRLNPSSPWRTRDHDYWEIFYINTDGESWNADRFAQTATSDTKSEGCFIQIGYAYFFPYSGPVEMVNHNIKITKVLKKIFGKWMKQNPPNLGGIEYANGLPSSKKQPKMKGLDPQETAIIHKLTGNWGPHVEEKNAMPSTGWNTIIDEDVFSGPLIYSAFPWNYDKQRPLLKNKRETRRYLNKKALSQSPSTFVRPSQFLKPYLTCPSCRKNHERELWRFYHPKTNPPSRFKKLP